MTIYKVYARVWDSASGYEDIYLTEFLSETDAIDHVESKYGGFTPDSAKVENTPLRQYTMGTYTLKYIFIKRDPLSCRSALSCAIGWAGEVRRLGLQLANDARHLIEFLENALEKGDESITEDTLSEHFLPLTHDTENAIHATNKLNVHTSAIASLINKAKDIGLKVHNTTTQIHPSDAEKLSAFFGHHNNK